MGPRPAPRPTPKPVLRTAPRPAPSPVPVNKKEQTYIFENQRSPNIPARRPKPTSRFDEPTEPSAPTKTLAEPSAVIENYQTSMRDNVAKFIPPTRRPVPISRENSQTDPRPPTKPRPRVNNRARGPKPPQSETNIAVTTELSRFQQYQVRDRQRQSGQVEEGFRKAINTQTKTEPQIGQDKEVNEIQDSRKAVRKP